VPFEKKMMETDIRDVIAATKRQQQQQLILSSVSPSCPTKTSRARTETKTKRSRSADDIKDLVVASKSSSSAPIPVRSLPNPRNKSTDKKKGVIQSKSSKSKSTKPETPRAPIKKLILDQDWDEDDMSFITVPKALRPKKKRKEQVIVNMSKKKKAKNKKESESSFDTEELTVTVTEPNEEQALKPKKKKKDNKASNQKTKESISPYGDAVPTQTPLYVYEDIKNVATAKSVEPEDESTRASTSTRTAQTEINTNKKLKPIESLASERTSSSRVDETDESSNLDNDAIPKKKEKKKKKKNAIPNTNRYDTPTNAITPDETAPDNDGLEDRQTTDMAAQNNDSPTDGYDEEQGVMIPRQPSSRKTQRSQKPEAKKGPTRNLPKSHFIDAQEKEDEVDLEVGRRRRKFLCLVSTLVCCMLLIIILGVLLLLLVNMDDKDPFEEATQDPVQFIDDDDFFYDDENGVAPGVRTTEMAIYDYNCDYNDQDGYAHVWDQCACDGTVSVVPQDVAQMHALLVERLYPLFYGSAAFTTSNAYCDPVNLALLWLASGDNRDAGYIRQRFVLALIFFGMDGPEWDHQNEWMTPLNECLWLGNQCNKWDVVNSLALDSNNIFGTVRDTWTIHSVCLCLDYLLLADFQKSLVASFGTWSPGWTAIHFVYS
jgi:hypothetical protein